MAFLSDLLVKVGADISEFKSRMQQVSDDLNKADRDARKATQGFDAFGQRLTSLGTGLTAALTLPLAGVSVAALKMAGDFEQARIAMTTMLGSADRANDHLGKLRDFALKTPFEFPDLLEASKRLQALGFKAGEIIPTLTAVGNATAALGSGSEGIQRITLALGQMQAKGKVQAEEMRQLAEAGIPAWQILAKTLNTDVAGAMALVEKRAVDSATAVPALLAGLNERFGGLMAAQSQTLLGTWSNFKDKMTKTLTDIGEALIPVAKRMLTAIQEVTDAAGIWVMRFKELPVPVQNLGIGFGVLLAAIGPLILGAGALISSFAKVSGALTALSGWLSGATGLGAALSSVTVAVGVVAGAFAGWQILRIVDNLGKLITQNEFVRRSLDTVGTAASAAWEKMSKLLSVGGHEVKFDLPLVGGIGFRQIADGLDLFVDKTKDATDAARKLAENMTRSGNVGMAAFKDAVDKNATQAVDTLAVAFKTLGITSEKDLRANIDKAKEAVARVTEAFKIHKATAGDVQRAHEALAKATEELTGKHKDLGRFMFEMGTNLKLLVEIEREDQAEKDKSIQQLAELTRKARDLPTAWRENVDSLKELNVLLEQTGAFMIDISKIPINPMDAGANALKAAQDSADAIAAAAKRAGVSSVAEYDAAAKAAQEDYERIRESGEYSATAVLRAERRALQDSIEAHKAHGEAISANDIKRLDELNDALEVHRTKHKSLWVDVTREVDKAFDHMARGMADAIVHWKGFGESMKQVAQSFASGVLEIMFQRLLNPLKKGITDVLMGADGKGGLLGGVLSKIGEKIGGLFGGLSGTSGVITNAIGGGTGIAGAAGGAVAAGGGAAGSASGAIGSSLTGIVGAVGSVVGAVSGVIGNFQMHGMNEALDVIVKHTLQTVYIGEATFYLLENRLTSIHSRLVQALDGGWVWRLEDIWGEIAKTNAILSGGKTINVTASGGGGAATINNFTIDMNGAYVLSPRGIDDFADFLINRMRQRGIKI